jgi:hypothetical protein
MPFRIVSPYTHCRGTWLKGNLHGHTTRSDGRLEPDEYVQAYRQAGYDFVAATDHDICTPLHPADGILVLPGTEVTANGPHICALGISQPIPPAADRREVLHEAARRGGIAVVNHPNWQSEYTHCPQALLEAWEDYCGLEIYNAKGERQDGNALATDRWDRLLSHGRTVWGFANDDMHLLSDLGKAWNMVCAEQRKADNILEALRNGWFYASTGVVIHTISHTDVTIRIETENAHIIRFLTAVGREVGRFVGTNAEYTLSGSERLYIRAECYGHGTSTAWTQPFRLSAD